MLLLDSLESADFSSTNTDGFHWENPNKTSIVTKDAVVNNGSPINNPIENGWYTGRNWDPREPELQDEVVGEHMMRYRYAAGAEWTEQRYDLGGAYPEIWISYWMRVPTNYSRPSGTNNKWFNIWMGRSKNQHSEDYENPGISRIEMQDWAGSNQSMDIRIQFRNGTDGVYANSNTHKGLVRPEDAGRWMHVVYHFKASSSNNANDGILRMYRRWHGQQNHELINDLNNINVGVGSGSQAVGRLGWGAGYIMGYANATYNKTTEWLLDDFTVSTESLIIAGQSPSPPNTPSNFAVTPVNTD